MEGSRRRRLPIKRGRRTNNRFRRRLRAEAVLQHKRQTAGGMQGPVQKSHVVPSHILWLWRPRLHSVSEERSNCRLCACRVCGPNQCRVLLRNNRHGQIPSTRPPLLPTGRLRGELPLHQLREWRSRCPSVYAKAAVALLLPTRWNCSCTLGQGKRDQDPLDRGWQGGLLLQ